MSLRLAIKASLQDLAPPVPPPAPAQPSSSSSSVTGPPPKSKKDSPYPKGSKSSNASLADSSVSGASTQGHDKKKKKKKKDKKERRDKEGGEANKKDKDKKTRKKDKEDKDKKRKRKHKDKEGKEEKERRKKKKSTHSHTQVKQEDGTVVKGEEEGEEEELIISSEEEGQGPTPMLQDSDEEDEEQVEDSDDVLDSSSSSSEEEEEEEEDEALGRVDTPPVDMMKRSVKAVSARKGPQSLLQRRVRVQFAGGWYGGTITKVNEEKRYCRIAYDDHTRGTCRLDAKDVIVEPLLPGQRLEAKKEKTTHTIQHKQHTSTSSSSKDNHKDKDKDKAVKEGGKDKDKERKEKERERKEGDKDKDKSSSKSKEGGEKEKERKKDKGEGLEKKKEGDKEKEKKKVLLVKERSGSSIASSSHSHSHSKGEASSKDKTHKTEAKERSDKDKDKDKERDKDKGEKRPYKPPVLKPPQAPPAPLPPPTPSSAVKKPRREEDDETADKTTPKEVVPRPAPAPPTTTISKPEEEAPIPPPTPPTEPPTPTVSLSAAVGVDDDGKGAVEPVAAMAVEPIAVEGKRRTEWVQCEACDKWRKCPLDIVHTLPEQWYCHMNDWDPNFNSCKVAQEEDDDPPHHEEEEEEEEDGEGPRMSNAMDFIRASSEGGGSRGYGRGRGRGRRGFGRGRRGGFGGGYYRSEDQWVQCDGCAKWRRVPRSVDAQALPNKWFCSMATWGRALTCTVAAAGDNDQASVNSQSSRPQRTIRIPGGLPPHQQANVPNTPGSSGSRRTSRGDAQASVEWSVPAPSSLPTSPTPRRSTSAYSAYMQQQQTGGGQPGPSGTPATVVQVDWVQCEGCKKWRKLPAHVKVDSLPDVWFCRMNEQWDPNHASCEVAEEPYNPTPDPQATATAAPTTGGGKGGRGGSILGGGGGRQGKALSWRDIIFGSDGRVKSYFSDRGMNASVPTAIFEASPLFPINPYVLPPPRNPPPNMPPIPSTREFGPFALSTHYQPPTTIRSSLTNRTIPAPQPPPLPFLPVPTLAWRMYYRERKEAQQHDALHTQIDSYRRSGMIRSMVGAVLREATANSEGKAVKEGVADKEKERKEKEKGLSVKQVTAILRRRRFDAESEGCYLWEGLRQDVVGSSSSSSSSSASSSQPPLPPQAPQPPMPPPAAPVPVAVPVTEEVAAIASALTELVSMGRARKGEDETYVWTGGEGDEEEEEREQAAGAVANGETNANANGNGKAEGEGVNGSGKGKGKEGGEGVENVPAPDGNGEREREREVLKRERPPIVKVRSKDLAGKPFKACKPWKAH